jgi:pimeloyl-ACP methyl ester carboxylesterase
MKSLLKITLSLLILIVVLFGFLYRSDIPLSDLESKYFSENSGWMEWEGMKIHYRVEGEGPDLLLIHGTFASLQTWDGVAEELRNNFRIIRLDLPGFGLSGPHPAHDYSTQAYVRCVNALAKHLNLSSFSIGGNSLGGFVSWAYALDYPISIINLILLNAAGIQDPDISKDKKRPLPFRIAQNKVLGPILVKCTPKFMVGVNLKDVYFDPQKFDKNTLNRYYELLRREGNRVAFLKKSGAQYPIPDYRKISGISAPSLIIWGEHDRWIDKANAHIFHKLIPNSELHILPDAGHVPMEEVPKQTAGLIHDFLLNRD